MESSSSDETEYVEDEDQEVRGRGKKEIISCNPFIPQPFRKEERDFNIILSASKAQQKYKNDDDDDDDDDDDASDGGGDKDEDQ